MSDISELRAWLENEVDAGDEVVQVWVDKARSIEEQLEAAQDALRSIVNHGYEPGQTAYQNVERCRTIARNGLASIPASEPEGR